MVSIYGLINPITNELRYVGKTKQTLQARLNGHMKDSKRRTFSMPNWIKGLSKLNKKPEIVELECVGASEWVEAEMFWIAYAKYLGAKLLNHSLGGDGSVGFKLTDETKNKIRLANLGKTLSEETKEKLRSFGKSVPKESLAFYKAGLGKPRPQEVIEKISKSHIGMRPTEETIEKIRNTLQGYKHTDAAKENMRKARLGKKCTEESRMRMKEAAFRREAIKRENRKSPTKAQGTREDGAKAGVVSA